MDNLDSEYDEEMARHDDFQRRVAKFLLGALNMERFHDFTA